MSTQPYAIVFYETSSGRCYTREFLYELAVPVRAKFSKWLEALEREGPNLPRPYADIVRGKIRELRVSFAGQQYRFLYFFYDKQIVITQGFVKKSWAIPEAEIDKAQRRMADFIQRIERDEIME